MVATTSETKTHLLYLDGVRACAALFVVSHHAILQVDFGATPIPLAAGALIAAFTYGHYGVDVFIALSGFCLMIPVIKASGQLTRGGAHFYCKRARRILPPYFLAMGLSLLLIALFIGEKTGSHWDTSLPVTQKSIWAHVFLIQDVFESTSARINHAFWSISVEWRIYFLFPLLVALWRILGPLRTTALSIVGSLALLAGLLVLRRRWPDLNLTNSGICPHYIASFAIGMLAAEIALPGGRLARWREKAPWTALLVGLTALLALLSDFHRLDALLGAHVPWQLLDLLVAGWTLCLLTVCAKGGGDEAGARSWLYRLLSSPLLVWLGTFAYSIYLIHAPLLQLIWQYLLLPLGLGPTATLWTLVLAGTPLTVGACYGFFLLCEKPFLNQRRRESLVKTEFNAALEPAP